MQLDPVDSTKMNSVDDDHGAWDEKNLALLGKEEPLDIHELELWCNQRLDQLLQEQELLIDSAKWKWDTWERLSRMAMEIHGRFKVQIEHEFMESLFDCLIFPKWDRYFENSLGMLGLLQPLPDPDDLPELWRLNERLRRHALLCIGRAYYHSQEQVEKFPGPGVDTNNVFSSMYVPTYVRKFHLFPNDDQLEARHRFIHSADAKGNLVTKNIFVISSAGNGSSSSEGAASTLTGDNIHHRETDGSYDDMPEVIFDNMAHVNCTGNFKVFSNINMPPKNIVLVAANEAQMDTFISGDVHQANFELTDVHYCPDLGNKLIVSGSILDKNGYGYEFGRGKFTVKDLKNGRIVGEGRLVGSDYILDYLKISGDCRSRAPGLVTTVWNAVSSALHRLGVWD